MKAELLILFTVVSLKLGKVFGTGRFNKYFEYVQSDKLLKANDTIEGGN